MIQKELRNFAYGIPIFRTGGFQWVKTCSKLTKTISAILSRSLLLGFHSSGKYLLQVKNKDTRN